MKALSVAAYVVDYCIKKDHAISNLQLQKFLFFIQLRSIKDNSHCMLIDEPFEAWQLGPVIREVYEAYCLLGASPIFTPASGTSVPTKMADYVNNTVEKCLKYRIWDLVQKSHYRDGAWFKTVQKNGYKTEIPSKYLIEDAGRIML